MIHTQIFRVNLETPQQNIIQNAAQAIQAGQLVVFPTETVYGVGADAFNPIAVHKIFEAKNRPTTDPLIVHIGQIAQLTEVVQEIPDAAWHLIDRLWPGPLTLILKRHPNVPASVSAGLNTVAVRMPRHRVALALLEQAGTGIAAPSANLFTRPSATTVEHVLQDLDGRVTMILDAGRPTIGLESTVLDLTMAVPTILRPGGTSVETLQTLLPNVRITSKYHQEGELVNSPGMLSKHYSPQAQVQVFEGENNQAVLTHLRQTALELIANGLTIGIMATAEEASIFAGIPARIVITGTQNDLSTVGHNLFALMRQLDADQVDVILVKAPDKAGLGLAIRDRLVRAAEGHLIRVD